ncbi:hypothetical protein I552_8051 [Mycobacterium xenopi 3993]|nr:hypothetical protein I552_8051 [Mycobacterium xenopi 3993]
MLSDLLLSKGEYQLKLPPPFIAGMETAEVVRSAPRSRPGVRGGAPARGAPL